MKAKCTNGCFEIEISKEREKELREDIRGLVCANCWKHSVILIEET